jgi:hypothetical protein
MAETRARGQSPGCVRAARFLTRSTPTPNYDLEKKNYDLEVARTRTTYNIMMDFPGENHEQLEMNKASNN